MKTRNRPPRNRRTKPLHRCQYTGKIRFRTRKDAKLALRNATRARAIAELTGADTCTRQEVRYYRCPCGGFHLTSTPNRRPVANTTLTGLALVAAASGLPA